MIALPGQLFYTTQIPACLWFFWRGISRASPRRGTSPVATGEGETLFIDARKLGVADRPHPPGSLTDEEIARHLREPTRPGGENRGP